MSVQPPVVFAGPIVNGMADLIVVRDPAFAEQCVRWCRAERELADERTKSLALAQKYVAPPKATPPRPGGAKGKHIDERMLATIRDDPEAKYWSCRKWAYEVLHCSPSTVGGTRTWRLTCLPAREAERLARGKRLRRKRSAI